jgi:hypothetical protein
MNSKKKSIKKEIKKQTTRVNLGKLVKTVT